MDVFVVSFVDCLNFSLVCILPCATSQDRAVKLSSRGRVTSRYARALLQTSETILSANIETISQFRDFIWWWHRPARQEEFTQKSEGENAVLGQTSPSPCSWICCNLFTSLEQFLNIVADRVLAPDRLCNLFAFLPFFTSSWPPAHLTAKSSTSDTQLTLCWRTCPKKSVLFNKIHFYKYASANKLAKQ